MWLLAERERDTRHRAKERRELVLLAIAAALAVPLVLPMLLSLLGIRLHVNPWFQSLLATPIQVIACLRFLPGALDATRARRGNVELLILLGASASWLLSLYMVLRKGSAADSHVYFANAAMIVMLAILGRWLEARTRHQASPVRALLRLRPDTARVLHGTRETAEPTEAVKPGDRIAVRPGEHYPVDGRIIDGDTQTDESFFTGDSAPVAKHAGDTVMTGALNLDGRVVIAATAIGDDTTLLRMARSLNAAQSRHVVARRLVDRICAAYIPAVIAIAIGACFGWIAGGNDIEGAIEVAVSVLVIACPCVVGLATPATLAAGAGAAARAGIHVRGLQVLEQAATVDTMLIDRSGTFSERRRAAELVVMLEPMGITAHWLSGHADALTDTVREFSSRGDRVAMLGEGTGTAPALAAADVGIAPVTAADAAVEAADVTLARPDPQLVAGTIELARRTAVKIRQSLIWAFAFNVSAIPIAAIGLLTPAIAGLAMALSLTAVAVNLLLLRRWLPAVESRRPPAG
jgi:cation transport ATPase